MKNVILIIFISILTQISYGQMAVVDASAAKQLALINSSEKQSIAKAVATLEQLKSLREQYDKQLALVEEISSYVKQSKQVLNMKTTLSSITNQYTIGINYLYSEKELSVKDRMVFSKVYSKMVGDALEDFEYGTKILISGNLKMNDAERLNMLSDVEGKMNYHNSKIKYFNSTIQNAVYKKTQKLGSKNFIEKNTNSINKILN